MEEGRREVKVREEGRTGRGSSLCLYELLYA